MSSLNAPRRVCQGAGPIVNSAASLSGDSRVSQGSTVSMLSNVHKLTPVQPVHSVRDGVSQERSSVQRVADASEFVTQEHLKSALKEESEYWSARCMGEISRFECDANEKRDAQQSDLEAKLWVKLAEAAQSIQADVVALERRLSDRVDGGDANLEPDSSVATKGEESSVRLVRTEIEVCRSEMKEFKQTVQYFNKQTRQSVEHAESLIADLRKDHDMFRDEEMIINEGVKSSHKDLRKEFSDIQRELKDRMSSLERRSSDDASQHFQDLTSMIEASANRVKADMASEIARLQKDADADRAIEVNRAIAEARQIKETLDVNMAGLELSVHERLQETISTQDQLQSKMSGLDLESIGARLEVVELEGSQQRARLAMAEQALETQPLRHDSLEQTVPLVELQTRVDVIETSAGRAVSALNQVLSSEMDKLSARLGTVEATCSSSASVPPAVTMDVSVAADISDISARLDIMEHQASCRAASSPPMKNAEASPSDGLLALATRVDQMRMDLTAFQQQYQADARSSQSPRPGDDQATDLVQLRLKHEALRSEVADLSLIISQTTLAEDVATKAAEYIQAEKQAVCWERSEVSDVSRRLTRMEANVTAVEGKLSAECKRISGELGTRVDKIECNLLQSAQVRVKFNALENEVKATSRLVGTLIDSRPSKKMEGGRSLDLSTHSVGQEGVHLHDSPSSPKEEDVVAYPLLDVAARLREDVARIPKGSAVRSSSVTPPPSFSDEHASCAPSVEGSVADASQDNVDQALKIIKLVRDLEQSGDTSFQGIQGTQIIDRIQGLLSTDLLSKESHLIAAELPPRGTPLPVDLQESLEGLFKKIGRTLGSTSSTALVRDGSASHSTTAGSSTTPADTPDSTMHYDLRSLEKWLEKMTASNGGEVVGPSRQQPSQTGSLQAPSRRLSSVPGPRVGSLSSVTRDMHNGSCPAGPVARDEMQHSGPGSINAPRARNASPEVSRAGSLRAPPAQGRGPVPRDPRNSRGPSQPLVQGIGSADAEALGGSAPRRAATADRPQQTGVVKQAAPAGVRPLVSHGPVNPRGSQSPGVVQRPTLNDPRSPPVRTIPGNPPARTSMCAEAPRNAGSPPRAIDSHQYMKRYS